MECNDVFSSVIARSETTKQTEVQDKSEIAMLPLVDRNDDVSWNAITFFRQSLRGVKRRSKLIMLRGKRLLLPTNVGIAMTDKLDCIE